MPRSARGRAPAEEPRAPRPAAAVRHLLVAGLLGLLSGGLVALVGGLELGGLAAWAVASGIFLLRTWGEVWPLDGVETQAMATREDPGQQVTSAVLLVVAGVTLVTVVLVMFQGTRGGVADAVLGLTCIAGSWGLVHTVHMLRYARLYYSPPVGGLDFHQEEPPSYRDFAYLAVTIGTTFQVPDTDVADTGVRVLVLRHGLLAFAFNSVVIAATINVVAGLGK